MAVAYDATTGAEDFQHSIFIDNVNVIDNHDCNITYSKFWQTRLCLRTMSSSHTSTTRQTSISTTTKPRH